MVSTEVLRGSLSSDLSLALEQSEASDVDGTAQISSRKSSLLERCSSDRFGHFFSNVLKRETVVRAQNISTKINNRRIECNIIPNS